MQSGVGPGRRDREETTGGLPREFGLGFAAAVLATVASAAVLLISRRYFFNDDYATYFMPGFREIAQLLAHGQFPLVTDRVWLGGALLQEYRFAVFNPVSLALYGLIGRMDNMAAAAATFSLVHIAILAGGAGFVCRQLGCARRHAFLTAVLAPLSDWIFFWGATDWIPALVSMAWIVWAWGFLILTFRHPRFAPAAAVAVAMTLLSGWPVADLALLLSVLAAARLLVSAGWREHLRPAAWVAAAVIAGGLVAAPALVPLALYSHWAGRPAIDGAWATDLTGLLQVGMPFVHVRWNDGAGAVSQPIVFVAWFAPLVLVNADWKRLIGERRVQLLLGCVVAFAALSMISHIGLLRWMFRLLPYYQFAVLALTALALTRADEAGAKWSFDRMALVIAAEVWLAFGQAHRMALVYLGVAYAFGALAWLSARFKGRRDGRWVALALSTSVALFWAIAWTNASLEPPHYPQSWKPPDRAPAASARSPAGPTRFAIYRVLNSTPDPGPAFWAAYRPFNTTLDSPGASLVGYSPVLELTPAWGSLMCMAGPDQSCAGTLARAMAPIAPTGRSLIDLAGVDELAIQDPADASAFAVRAGVAWRQRRGAAGEWRFDRVAPSGLVTWVSPGLSAQTIAAAPAKVSLSVANTGVASGTMVLARAWYPGWTARLDGVPTEARPLDGLLVSVVVPPHAQGRLELTFWPMGLTLGLWLAALGVALLALASLFPAMIDVPARWLTRSRQEPAPSAA